MTGKDIGHFESSTKNFLPSGPKKGGKREVFLCMERVAHYMGGIMSWLLGEAGCQSWKAKHLLWKSQLQVSHLHMEVLHTLSS